MSGRERHLVLMARQPALGTVKRRLAADIGAVNAQRFYRNTTAVLLRRLGADLRWRSWLALTPDGALRRPCPPWPFRGETLPQGGGDLGDRMERVLKALPPGPVVIVGSDIPDIGKHHIAAAFRALGDHDWVFGPADDGGYWLVGARRRPRLTLPFAGVRWSSATALADSLAGLKGQRVAFLECLRDIDHGRDLADWRRACRAGRGRGV